MLQYFHEIREKNPRCRENGKKCYFVSAIFPVPVLRVMNFLQLGLYLIKQVVEKIIYKYSQPILQLCELTDLDYNFLEVVRLSFVYFLGRNA